MYQASSHVLYLEVRSEVFRSPSNLHSSSGLVQVAHSVGKVMSSLEVQLAPLLLGTLTKQLLGETEQMVND